jgi:hypothetical protein
MITIGFIASVLLVGVVCYQAGYSRGMKSKPVPAKKEPMGFKENSQKEGGL